MTKIFNSKNGPFKWVVCVVAFILFIASCHKKEVNPESKSATLHIEYEAKNLSFASPGFKSNVDVWINGVTHYPSAMNNDNIINLDLNIKGDQSITVNGYVIDSVGCGSSQSNIPVSLKIIYNNKEISNKSYSSSCSGSVQYQGKLEYIN
jgi:hypothetical protein